MSKRYKDGDLVFARLQGQIPWPARIEGDFIPEEKKYKVFVFGAMQHALCPSSDLSSFSRLRAQVMYEGKKKFAKALHQIVNFPKMTSAEELPSEPKKEEKKVVRSSSVVVESMEDVVTESGSSPALSESSPPTKKRSFANEERSTQAKRGMVTMPKRKNNTQVASSSHTHRRGMEDSPSPPSTPQASSSVKAIVAGRKRHPSGNLLDEENKKPNILEDLVLPLNPSPVYPFTSVIVPSRCGVVFPLNATNLPVLPPQTMSLPLKAYLSSLKTQLLEGRDNHGSRLEIRKQFLFEDEEEIRTLEQDLKRIEECLKFLEVQKRFFEVTEFASKTLKASKIRESVKSEQVVACVQRLLTNCVDVQDVMLLKVKDAALVWSQVEEFLTQKGLEKPKHNLRDFFRKVLVFSSDVGDDDVMSLYLKRLDKFQVENTNGRDLLDVLLQMNGDTELSEAVEKWLRREAETVWRGSTDLVLEGPEDDPQVDRKMRIAERDSLLKEIGRLTLSIGDFKTYGDSVEEREALLEEVESFMDAQDSFFNITRTVQSSLEERNSDAVLEQVNEMLDVAVTDTMLLKSKEAICVWIRVLDFLQQAQSPKADDERGQLEYHIKSALDVENQPGLLELLWHRNFEIFFSRTERLTTKEVKYLLYNPCFALPTEMQNRKQRALYAAVGLR